MTPADGGHAAVAPPWPLGAQRRLFDIPREAAHFDTAALGPLLRASVDAGQAGLARRAQPWRVGKDDWFDLADERRGLVARLLGVPSEHVALVPSVSYGAAAAAANLRAGSGAILALQEEFPSTANTWRRLAAETGRPLRFVARRPGETWTEAMLAAIDERVGLVSAPTVQWTDGAMLDLAPIGARARACGARLVVDATQSLGALPLDLGAARPDFLFAAGYKWLLGPYGLSYLYVAEPFHDGRPLEENWISRDGARDFARLAEPMPGYRPGARRFDAGEQAAFELAPAANAALRQLLAWGVDNVSRSLGEVTARIGAAAEALGLAVARAGERAPHIISLELPETAPDPAPLLARHGVYASRRGRRLRLSPHLHVDDTDLERLSQLLRQLAKDPA